MKYMVYEKQCTLNPLLKYAKLELQINMKVIECMKSTVEIYLTISKEYIFKKLMLPVRRVWINKLGTQLCENDKKVKETYLIDCLDK